MTESISEILKKAAGLKSKAEKVAFLKKYQHPSLRHILMCMYDTERVSFNIPTETPPPYNVSEHPDNKGGLWREARKLKYLVKGEAGDSMPAYKREHIFIQMLESVDKDDALLLLQMLKQEKIKGLTKSTINEAFPNTIA